MIAGMSEPGRSLRLYGSDSGPGLLGCREPGGESLGRA